jgi:hypothetical protein
MKPNLSICNIVGPYLEWTNRNRILLFIRRAERYSEILIVPRALPRRLLRFFLLADPFLGSFNTVTLL